MSKKFFSKTENGTEYRIYLLDNWGFPSLVRSALDAADGVHEELVVRVNGGIGYLDDKVLALADITSYDTAMEVLSSAARKMVMMEMEAEGWKYCIE